ncbi:hypothetical protein Hanom_Chr12g01150491 [Helianthus anomalus]
MYKTEIKCNLLFMVMSNFLTLFLLSAIILLQETQSLMSSFDNCYLLKKDNTIKITIDVVSFLFSSSSSSSSSSLFQFANG